MDHDLIAAAQAHVRASGLAADLAAVSAAAAERFAALSWPETTQEEWRRTSLATVDLAACSALSKTQTAAAVPSEYDDVAVYRGVSALGALPAVKRAALVAAMHDRIAAADNRFILWPYLFFADLIVVDVRQAVQMTAPLTLTTTLTGGNCFTAPIIAILSHPEAVIKSVHTIASADDEPHLCVHDSLTVVADGARVQSAAIHDLNINSYQFANGWATVARDAQVEHDVVVLGGLLSKERYDVHLVQSGAEAYLNGVYVAHEDQHYDLRTLQVHDAPATNSFALYRGVVLDEAHTIYQGLIRVTERATGTDAYLTNNNLLLSARARADSIPSLNISTDEVKCSHGSTTGSVDPVQLFYLQSRGLSQREAEAIIVEGFVDEVWRSFPLPDSDPMRAAIHDRIANR